MFMVYEGVHEGVTDIMYLMLCLLLNENVNPLYHCFLTSYTLCAIRLFCILGLFTMALCNILASALPETPCTPSHKTTH